MNSVIIPEEVVVNNIILPYFTDNKICNTASYVCKNKSIQRQRQIINRTRELIFLRDTFDEYNDNPDYLNELDQFVLYNIYNLFMIIKEISINLMLFRKYSNINDRYDDGSGYKKSYPRITKRIIINNQIKYNHNVCAVYNTGYVKRIVIMKSLTLKALVN